MTGMVSGLVIQTSATAKGRLQRTQRARRAAKGMGNGMGKNATKIPTKNAIETDCRFRWKRLEFCSSPPRKRTPGLSLMAAGLGTNRRIILRAIRVHMTAGEMAIMPWGAAGEQLGFKRCGGLHKPTCLCGTRCHNWPQLYC